MVSKLYQYNRYYKLVKQLQSILRDLGVKEEKLITNALEDLYKKNYEALSEGPTVPIREQDIQELIHQDWIGDGYNFSDRIWRNKAVMAKRAKDYVMLAIAEGKNPTQFINELEPYLNKAGLWQAKRLLLTEMSHVQYMSAMERYKNTGITKVKILTANDKRVCDKCKDNAKEIYTLENCPMLPSHPFADAALSQWSRIRLDNAA